MLALDTGVGQERANEIERRQTEVIKAAAERRKEMNYECTGMLSLDVLPDEPIPAGSYLVHNHVRPQKPLNGNGFRRGYRPRRTIW